MVKCYKCDAEFEPKVDDLKIWGESGESFDPTDWECPSCQLTPDEIMDWIYEVSNEQNLDFIN